MKYLVILSLLTLIFSTGKTHAQSLPCEWAKSAGGTGNTSARSVATDPFGNSFITGMFTGPTLAFGATTLINAGISNIYLAKYDGSGNILWAKSCQGNNKDYVFQVAADHSGNSIITGSYLSSSFIIGTDTISESYTGVYQHMLVAKFDPGGNLLWADHAIQGNANGDAIAVDQSDNLFVAGLFNGGEIVFGTDTLKDTGNTFFGNIFLVKYNSSGNVLWAMGSNGTNLDEFTSLATDPYGNLYVTGLVSSPVFNFGSYVLNNPGGKSVLTAKISAGGNVIWAKLSSSSLFNRGGSSVATDQQGNPYITGGFNGDSINFGPITIYNTAYNDTFQNGAMFVVKFDTSGNTVWAREEGYSQSAYEYASGTGIVTDRENNVYVCGFFEEYPVLIYGNDTLLADTANGGGNLFVAAYDGSGNLLWAKSPAGNASISASSISKDTSCNLFICGAYRYGAIDFGSSSLPAGDSANAFLVKLASPSKTLVNNIIAGNSDIKVYPVPSGNVLNISLPGNGYSALKIYDLTGREVVQKSCNLTENNSIYELDISKMANGMYVVQAIKNGLKINSKVVVER